MEFNGKIRTKIAILFAAGGLAIASPHLPKLQMPKQTENVQENFDKEEVKKSKLELKKQIKEKNVKIGKQLGEYITGIKVDGRKVSIELVDGKTLSGELDKLQLNGISYI